MRSAASKRHASEVKSSQINSRSWKQPRIPAPHFGEIGRVYVHAHNAAHLRQFEPVEAVSACAADDRGRCRQMLARNTLQRICG